MKNKIKELRLEVVIRKSKEIEHRHSEEVKSLYLYKLNCLVVGKISKYAFDRNRKV